MWGESYKLTIQFYTVTLIWYQMDSGLEAHHIADILWHDIWDALEGCMSLEVKQIYQEMNSNMDYIAFYIAKHLGDAGVTCVG